MEGFRMNVQSDLRPSPIAGQWYSGYPALLSDQVDNYLMAARLPSLDGQVVGLIAPHAGHLYSGPVAGYAYRCVQGETFDLVAVIAPMHRPNPQPLLTTAHSGYSTPLGAVPVDPDAIARLDAELRQEIHGGLAPVRRDSEHSLEIQLPFLQRALAGPFWLLPVMVRDQDPPAMQALGRALARTLAGRSALLVASSDLSHFYPARIAEQMDGEILRQIESFSPEGLYRVAQAGKGSACGLGAIAAVMWAARELGATTARMLQYASSGDITQDFSSVVGYGAAVILKPT